jgi:hypothetical protein
MKKLLIVIMALTMFSACDNSSKKDNTTDDAREKELHEKELELARKEQELKDKEANKDVPEKEVVKEKEIIKEKTAPDFQADPVKIMQAIFHAAASEDYSKLAGLCDPKGNGDADTKLICNMQNLGAAAQQTFKVQFAFGKVIGSPDIDGEKAKVNFKYGLNAGKDGTMEMVKRNGKWYLSSY